MIEKMTFKECKDKGIIIETVPDEQRSFQLINMADLRLLFWSNINDSNAISLKVEAYYDVIKELIFAHIYKNGFNCSNHLCLIAYLKEKISDFDYEIQKIDELRKVRNEINYRGFIVKKDYLDRNELEFNNIISKLKQLLV